MEHFDNNRWYLYHIRDPEKSAGFGHDGYIGITKDPARRKHQHLSRLSSGNHRNAKLQAAHDSSSSGLKFWIVSFGTREQILARERLLVPKPDHHLNAQIGGGPIRGITAEQASKAANSDLRSEAKPVERSSNRSASGRQNESSAEVGVAGIGGLGIVASESSAGTAMGMRAALAGASGTAALVGSGLVAVGLGSAHLINKTILKDETGIPHSERRSRRDGRIGTYAGGAAGAAGTLTAVGASGTVVGLSASGIAAGVTAIGASVGGGAIAGAAIVVALPAIAAFGLGYSVYRVSNWLRSSSAG